MVDVNIDKAIGFVQASGDVVLSALAQYSTGKVKTTEVLEIIKQYQRADGGWSKTDKDFQGDLSVVSTTWLALQWLLWIDAGDRNELQVTLDYLAGIQKTDGCWDEADAIMQFDPPPWMQPGKYENQLWLTSAVCCKLKELCCESAVRFEAALDFLRDGWDGRRYPVYNHTHWMVLGLLGLIQPRGSSDIQILLGCRDFLHDAIENDQVDPGDYSAIVYASKLAGDQAGDLFALSLGKLLENQREDGGWHTNYGEMHRPGLTVEVLFTLKRVS